MMMGLMKMGRGEKISRNPKVAFIQVTNNEFVKTYVRNTATEAFET